jgi:hypothetical protein
MLPKSTRARFLTLVLGFGCFGLVAVVLPSCENMNSLASPTGSAQSSRPVATPAADDTVNPSCIVCVARATEQAQTASEPGTGPAK